MTPAEPTLPTYADVEAAAARIEGVAHRTPVLTSRLIDELVGAQVFFKCENLQRIGAFKIRGAYNALSRLTLEQKRAGVVAFSSGNHAQAVALAASMLGIAATIVMPSDARIKLAATKAYGAEVVEYDRYTEDREAITNRLARERGLTTIPPFNHPDVVAGQGTAARELFQEVGALDALFTPVGGGGLLSGSAISAKALSPSCKLYGVEPEAGDDARQSLEKGEIVTIGIPATIADGVQNPRIGDLTFAILSRLVDDIRTVTDEQLVEAMRLHATYMKLVVEPTGCLGLAAVRKSADELAGQRVGVIISGGNVDLDRYAALLAG